MVGTNKKGKVCVCVCNKTEGGQIDTTQTMGSSKRGSWKNHCGVEMLLVKVGWLTKHVCFPFHNFVCQVRD